MKKFGRYELKRELGRGGMATVFLAHDPRFGRDVALKTLPPVFLHDEMFLGRFEREARTVATLEHTAIVPVYDFGEHDGQPYLVMRYMAGGTLADRMRAGPMDLDKAAAILNRLAEALDYAHSRHVVHRDLKPGNILFDDQDKPYLSDFGIAKLAEATVNLTGSAIIGTPAYMSPEQVHGDQAIDGRADIYALGIIIFQMLTGQLPYMANTPAKQLMAHVLNPVPHIYDVRHDLPPECDAVITRAMAKNREERYETASRMASELTTISRVQPRESLALPEAPADAATLVDAAPPEPIQLPAVEAPEPVGVAHAAEGERPSITPDPLLTPTRLEPTTAAGRGEPPTAPRRTPLQPGAGVLPLEPAASPPPSRRRLPAWTWAAILLGVILLAAAGIWWVRGQNDRAAGGVGRAPGDPLKLFIEARWQEDFDVTSLAYGDRQWGVVMSQGADGSRQIWHAARAFPRAFIEARWAEEFDVTSLAYGDNEWLVIMAQRPGVARQIWHLAPAFPSEFIEQKWAEGFDVTELAYGGGRWAVIMSQRAVDGQQTWHLSPEFPREFIEARWDEGYDITALAFGDRRWAVVMSQGTGNGRQLWHVAPDFPKEFIEAQWADGYDVTQLAFGDGRWAVVLAQTPENPRQTWQTNRAFR